MSDEGGERRWAEVEGYLGWAILREGPPNMATRFGGRLSSYGGASE